MGRRAGDRARSVLTRGLVARTGLAVAFALMLIGSAVGTVLALREFDAVADGNSALDYADREVAWGNGLTLNQEAVYAARSLIPPEADYEVLVGPIARFDDAFTPTFVARYYHYFLMPRRPRAGAGWAVCYRCDRPPRAEVLWEDDANGIAVLRRRAPSA